MAERPVSETKGAYLVPLTSLRGVAAVLVVVFHAAIWQFSPYFVSATKFAVKGYLWVDFFFLLSGFVLAHSYGGRFAAGVTRRRFADYLTARFARIYPLHLATLLFLVLVIAARSETIGFFTPATKAGLHFTVPSFIANLFLVQALGIYSHTTWNEPAWSISCESAMYLAFPFLSFALAGAGKSALAAASGLCGAALIAIYTIGDPTATSSGIVRCAAEFSLGLCLYRVYAARRVPRLLSRDAAALAVCVVLVLSLHAGLFDLLIVPQFALLLLVAAQNESRFKMVLSRSVPQFLGRISYSIYLVHWPFFYGAALVLQHRYGKDILERQSNPVRVLVLLASLATIVGIAALTYRWIEVPCRRWLAPGRTPRTGPFASLPEPAEG